MLALFSGANETLVLPPRSVPLDAPAGVVNDLLTPARSVAPGGPSSRHGHSHGSVKVDPPPTGGTGEQHGPFAPLGPASPSSFAAVATGASGGAAFVLWCALLVGLLICAARPLRRHVLPSVVFAPTAFVSLLQRPG
jgi:hypothetical protein